MNIKITKYDSERNLYLFIAILSCTVITGCNSSNIINSVVPPSFRSSAAPESEPITISATDLTLSHLNKKQKRQSKNKISITIETVSNELEKWYRYDLQEVPVAYTVSSHRYPYIQKKVPFYQHDSDRVKLRAKIQNNSDRVLHLKNAIVSFDIDGNNTSVAGDFYSNLSNALITPNSNKEVVFYGPKISDITDKTGTIKLGIYEVTVGNKYANYEWHISYKTITVTKSSEITASEITLTHYEAEKMQNKTVKAN
jgi:uncharacterized glyoxalase superfamily protein PhnB